MTLEHTYKQLPVNWHPQLGLNYPLTLNTVHEGKVTIANYREHHYLIKKLFNYQ